MHAFYNLGIHCYGLAVRCASPFSKKAALWVNGRAQWRKRFSVLSELNQVVWFHCASLGEFEQGRPVMEALKKAHPDKSLVVTFFSPSGYEIRKNYELADWVGYLPLDTPKNARDFIHLIKPEQVFFVKYEFWANYLFELRRQKIPAYCVSGLFRPSHRFFKSYGGFFRSVLGCFEHFFVQTEQSKELLNAVGFSNVTVSGDTRYDRVLQNAQQVQANEWIRRFSNEEPVFVIGSSWSQDEEIVFRGIQDGIISGKIIIAPHEIDSGHIRQIQQNIGMPSLCFTECHSDSPFERARVLILDCIGQLANAYRFGTLAYVGGAFGKGLHNILEPAVFGLPVIFGPNHSKFPEAQEFIDAGIGFSIADYGQFRQAYIQIQENQAKLSKMASDFVQSKSGATSLIMKVLNEKSTR
jgi:3-deoxy-D-manno-octulosonic-acid transferase